MDEMKEKNDKKDLNVIEDNSVQNNKKEKEDQKNYNMLEKDIFKYDLDYTSKCNSLDNLLKPISKQKLLIQIFLVSSRLNMFNKIISLEKLYTIIDSEKNFQMIYYIVSKIMKYIKEGRMSIYVMNTNLLFCPEFLSSNQNYFFAYKIFNDLKQMNDNLNLDIKIMNEINEFIKVKIDYFEKFFLNLVSIEQITSLNNIINNILNNKKEELEGENNGQFIYLINKAWLQNAQIFIGNYLFAIETQSINSFFKDSFDIKNVLSVFLGEKHIEKAIENKTYYPFPGPINNFPLTDFKDILLDPITEEENYIIKRDIMPQRDYYWINNNDWNILKDVFSCTNEIRRKKDEIDMIQINAIIFDSRMRKFKNESINLMKKKIIQISNKKSIKDFELKLIRCLNNEANNLLKNNKNENKNEFYEKEDVNENIIYLYKIDKKNRDIIIEIFLSFVSDIESYESYYLNEIIFSEEEKEKGIDNIFKQYNHKTEILIIEIYSKKIKHKFLEPIIPKLNYNKEKIYYCSICNKEIFDLNKSKNNCKLCNMYLFCSQKCAEIINNKEDNKIKKHLKIHRYLSEITMKPFKIKDFLSRSFYNEIYTQENKDKNKGVVGLFNLGNTCYMNCSLQCLSNTKDLTKYFINNVYQNEINLETTLGSNGILVKSYSDLINLMWFSSFIKINPYFFRIAFSISTNKFMNNNQQDAMDFILILLNYLHEDLNRIKEKPYLILKEQGEKESDVLASQRVYNYYHKRENSIIMDLFSGQFQNIIKCTTCFTEKKTYEPFMNISLPIPEEHNFYIIKFFTNLNCKYITMNVTSNTTFSDLIKKACNYLSKNILDAIKDVKKQYGENEQNDIYIRELLEKNIDIVKLDKNKIIDEIYLLPNDNDEKLKKYINDEEEIVLFEKEIIPDYHQNIYVYPITTNKNNEDEVNFLSYPIIFSVKHDLTIENLEKCILEKLSHIIIDNKIIKNSHIIDLHILHSNKNMNTGIMRIIKDYPKCIFCNMDYGTKKFCPLYLFFNKNDTISKIFKYSKGPFILLARSSYYDINKEVYPEFNFKENNNLNNNKNIYDSFNQFGNFEILGNDNLWNCPKCLVKRNIGKSIKIYRPPNYLILQLKRFKKKSGGFFDFLEGDKNETFVSFPTKNLDLSNYIQGPEKNKSIYNLYAVINHKSLFGYNHFTSFCRNNKKWIEYDDHKINYDIKNPVTNEAYILFYIKKSIDENF